MPSETELTHEQQEKRDAERADRARSCEFFEESGDDTPCLWHRCFCHNPQDLGNRPKDGMRAKCYLVWRGECIYDSAARHVHE